MIIVNGELKTQVQLDSSLDSGMGVFETIDVRDRPLFLSAHIKRLNDGLKVLKIHREIREEDVRQVICDYRIRHSALKLIVTEKNTVYKTRPNPYNEELTSAGLRLAVSPSRRNETSSMVYIKSINYAENYLARNWAADQGCDEVLFLNTRDQVAECSASNIFWTKDEKICTPHLQCGVLPGIMRGYLLETYAVEEGTYTLDDLMQCDGAFVTNSLMGIIKVRSIGGQAIGEHRKINLMADAYKAWRN